MPKLIANDGSQLVVQGEEVSVGRRDGGSEPVDLDLGALERGRTVSRRHARIIRLRSGWTLRVEPSVTNETKVAGRVLKAGEEAPLTDGDEILLGAVTLTFRADFDPEATMVRQAAAPAKFVSGEGIEFPLAAPEGRRLWVGRPQQGTPTPADFIDLSSLPGGRSVSHLHAQVYRTSTGWVLREGKTTNATLVNGRQLTQGEDVPLTDGVSIQLGRVRLTFNENRPARIVPSDVLTLEADQQELSIDPGRTESLGLRLVNATGRVEVIDVELEGLPKEWYQIAGADGTRGPVWRVQLVPTGPDLVNPLPNSVANARLIITPPRAPQSRAGTYPITISATTRGEDQVRRVITGRVHILKFEGLQFTLSPSNAKGASAKFTAEVVNTGNADADVDLTLEPEEGLRSNADPPALKLSNGADQRSAVKARVKHHHWWGPRRTYGLHVTASSGTQRLREGIALTCFPIIPEWLQGILSRLIAILSPIAIPAVTLVLLIGLAYLFLRPPDIAQFYASAPAVAAGGAVQLNWAGDRISSVDIEPPPPTKPVASDGQISVTPDKTTEYTFTAKNWIGLSSSAKARVAVVRITKFDPSTTSLTQEGQEVTLTWETDGADSVRIEPGDEVQNPKPSDSAKVHPSGNTTYTLIAAGPGGLEVKDSRTISIGAPTLEKFEVTDPPPGTRVFPGSQVKLNWKVTGATKATLTADKGEVAPGRKELDVTSGPPATVQPTATGDVTYTLTVSNAAGSKKDTVKVNVSTVSVQFDSDPASITAGESAKLRWHVDGANDRTQVTIDNDVGKVEPTGDKTVKPTDTTEYTLTAVGADGVPQEKKTTITVKAPLPKINIFTAPTPQITLGDQLRLTWTVDNADTIEIRTDQNDLIVPQTNKTAGSVIDVPPGSTTYILTATNASGKSTQSFSVVVVPPGATPVPPTPAPAAQPAGTAPSPAPKPKP
jgi:pSer/pThr/pTyr-binding forkhead associated (FHA) protein